MELTYAPWGESVDELVTEARAAEDAGFGRVWVSELHRSAFVPSTAIATGTSTIGIGTAIALAFVRSPMITALTALDLDEVSSGRFTLGLGTGVQRLNEDWHHARFGRPAPHLRETVQIIRAVIDNVCEGNEVDVEGEFERIRLRGYERPFPKARPTVPIHIASVGEVMTRLAGEIGDGWIAHELGSPRYLAEVVLPNIEAGQRRAGRSRPDTEIVASACCVIDDDSRAAKRKAAGLVAFYATVRTYEAFFDFHGFLAEAKQIQEAFRAGDHAGMVDACPDEMVDALAIAGTADEVRERVAAYEGIADAIKLSPPTHEVPPEVTREAQRKILEVFAPMTDPTAAPFHAITPSEFPWFDYGRYTFSLGLQRDSSAWLSGHSASEYDPGEERIVVKGGMADQTRTAYAKIAAILEAADLDLGRAQRVVEYVTVTGLDHYAEAEAVRTEVFGEHAPAVCTVVVDRLLRPAAFIEIEVTAGDGATTVGSGPAAGSTPAGAAAVLAGSEAVYLSSLLPVTADGEVVAPGDLRGQTAYVLEEAGRRLESVGLDLSHVVKTVDYTTPATRAEYPRSGRPRKELLGPVYPGSAGILASRLPHPGALISLDVIASRHTPEPVNPGWSRYEKLTYSPAVKAGNVLFMSGQAALDVETEQAVLAGDVVAQAEYTYANIITVLEAAGLGPEHLVKTIEYVTPEGLADYRGVAKVRDAMLRSPYPASTGCVCAGLLRPEFLIEIDPMAIFPT